MTLNLATTKTFRNSTSPLTRELCCWSATNGRLRLSYSAAGPPASTEACSYTGSPCMYGGVIKGIHVETKLPCIRLDWLLVLEILSLKLIGAISGRYNLLLRFLPSLGKQYGYCGICLFCFFKNKSLWFFYFRNTISRCLKWSLMILLKYSVFSLLKNRIGKDQPKFIPKF